MTSTYCTSLRVIPAMTFQDIHMTSIQASILTFYLAQTLKSIWHIFWHIIWHIFGHFIWQISWHSTWHFSGIDFGILSDTYSNILSILLTFRVEYYSVILSGGWGRAVPTANGTSPVEVRRCPRRSWTGSGDVHCNQELPVEVRRCLLRPRAGKEGGGRTRRRRRRGRSNLWSSLTTLTWQGCGRKNCWKKMKQITKNKWGTQSKQNMKQMKNTCWTRTWNTCRKMKHGFGFFLQNRPKPSISLCQNYFGENRKICHKTYPATLISIQHSSSLSTCMSVINRAQRDW